MEKFSAYRDPGTGIQPFLTPLSPQAADSLKYVLLPISVILGAIRGTLVCVLVILFVMVHVICRPLALLPPLYRTLSHTLTAVLSRLVLLIAGFVWIRVDTVKRRRGKGATAAEYWNPKAGDVIVSNWVSWAEILWLAMRFDPTFVLPITEPVEKPMSTSSPRKMPGRRNRSGPVITVQPAARALTKRAKIIGFRRVHLLTMLNACGRVPPYSPQSSDHSPALSLEQIRKDSRGPVVCFPECTTSNGRGLLRFASTFAGITVPVGDFEVFIMSVRIDPPTQLSPSVSLPIPSTLAILNPLPHVFTLASSILPNTLSIRLLTPSESPSSATFLVSDALSSGARSNEQDLLSDVCAALISDVGRLKRTGMGWEDKTAFLELYTSKGN